MLNKNIFFIVVLIWLSITVTSCAGRKVFKARTTSVAVDSIKEIGKRTIIQQGEKIVFIPKINYKDATIVIRRKNVISKITYDNKGAVKQVNCEQEFKKIIEKYIKQQKTTVKTERQIKQTKKESFVKDVWFVYIGLILAILLIINKKIK